MPSLEQFRTTIAQCARPLTESSVFRSSTSRRCLPRSAACRARRGAARRPRARESEVGPPQHVIDALAAAANEPSAHGYPPFRGLPALREAIAARYSALYGVELDPHSEVTIMPGTKTAICELALVLAERGSTIVLPDPVLPGHPSGPALAGTRTGYVPLDRDAGWAPDFAAAPRDDVAAVFLNYPRTPARSACPRGRSRPRSRTRTRPALRSSTTSPTGTSSSMGAPRDLPRRAGCAGSRRRDVLDVEDLGMAGWRLGFVVGNAEIVSRLDLPADHMRVGVFTPVQHAGIAALTGPQDSVAERAATYRRRRERVCEVLPTSPPKARSTSGGSCRTGSHLERLVEYRVAVATGEGFGSRGTGWARLSLAVTDEVLETGLARLENALQGG